MISFELRSKRVRPAKCPERREPNKICMSMFLALVCATCLFPSVRVFAQAAPGPLPPAQPVPPSEQMPAPPPRKQRPAIEPRKTLAGYWRLNADESDDPRKKLEDARRPSGGIGGGGRPTGGGFPFPGSGCNGPFGGCGGGGMGGQGGETDERTQDMVRSAYSLNIVLKDPEIDLTDDQGRKLAFYTDGRKIQKSKDDSAQQISAHWNGSQLASDEKSPQGRKMSRTLELSSDGTQLYETWHIENNRSNSTVIIHYVYDADTEYH